MYADFMRFFPQLGIDPVAALDGPQYFALANRVLAYGGVMAARVRQMQEDGTFNQEQPTQSLKPRAPKIDDRGRTVVGIEEFRAMNPGIISKYDPETKKVSL